MYFLVPRWTGEEWKDLQYMARFGDRVLVANSIGFIVKFRASGTRLYRNFSWTSQSKRRTGVETRDILSGVSCPGGMVIEDIPVAHTCIVSHLQRILMMYSTAQSDVRTHLSGLYISYLSLYSVDVHIRHSNYHSLQLDSEYHEPHFSNT